ncbi:TetR/AcrR family transcriptional regulator [Amycolatopsis sp. 195334CR]|uniref:TetR/AcrR family transcriptional regulator n=1 Tax=Amycolatopsis sp. 195334CR TaxID=2814588 RepID=UPI001A8C8167|nr:TetR/AcrR family transcriptional regulator [Amycolatopsis sp. 195334CR]MBN6040962.1 TetR/AcrR family transcriptional regulator [Amycolatopsis sp. 195334CR]
MEVPLGQGWQRLCRSVYYGRVIKGEQTRAKLIGAARTLVEEKGYHGTALNEVLALAGAPRGSLYHHFPGGKDQLVGEALTAAGQEVDELLAGVARTAAGARALVPAVLAALADRMQAADYAKGCPVATVALEVAASEGELQALCGEIYAGWEGVLAEALRAEGREPAEAEELAATVLALIEGSLVLARAHRSRVPVERVTRRIDLLLGRG